MQFELRFVQLRNHPRQADSAQALLQCLLGFIEHPGQSRFDMAAHGATFFDWVLMDGKSLWCPDRPIDLEQRDLTRPGQPKAPFLPVAVSTRPALDNSANTRRTKLELVFTLPAIRAELTSSTDAWPKLAMVCVAMENCVLTAIL
jgi:hypothetical protein